MKVPLIGNPGSVVRCPKGVKSVGSAPDGNLLVANEQAVKAVFFPPLPHRPWISKL
jgi:hypothetical protein